MTSHAFTILQCMGSRQAVHEYCMSSRQVVDEQLQIAQTGRIMLHAVTCLFVKPCRLLAEAVPGAHICQAPWSYLYAQFKPPCLPS